MYTARLYERIISSIIGPKSLAIDVGCGSGKVTRALAPHFKRVIGVDPSQSQLNNAPDLPNGSFHRGTSDLRCLALEDSSVACNMAAQAAHWLDLPALYASSHRLLQPGGVLALWAYGIPCLPNDSKLELLIEHHLYVNGDYWDPRRRIVEHLYQELDTIDSVYPYTYSTDRICDESLDIVRQLDTDGIVSFLQPWSGKVDYMEAKGVSNEPLRPIVEYIQESNFESTTVVSPVQLFLSCKQQVC